VEKRKRLADPTEDLLSVARMRDGVKTMVSRGTSLLASKVNKRRPPSSANKVCNKPFGGVACIPPAFRLSDLSDDTDFVIVVDDGDKKPAAKPPRSQIQTLLTNNGPTNAAKATLDMNYLVTAFILEEGLPFSIVGSKNLSRIIAMAKLLPTKYNLPNRQKISGDLMDILYEQRVKNNEVQLQIEANIYGLGLYCDGATIKKMPLYNILACGVHMPHAVLEIKDCSSQMASGGTKSAEFIADLMAKHIDGAANVQKAGRILEAKYPRVTSIHGAEHVVSLFFSDFAKTEVGMYFIRTYQLVYKWFGGCHHTPYAMFMSHSRKCNGGQLIGLIKPSGTRMGGYAIALTRLIRLKESSPLSHSLRTLLSSHG
jgi:hypothetical protein